MKIVKMRLWIWYSGSKDDGEVVNYFRVLFIVRFRLLWFLEVVEGFFCLSLCFICYFCFLDE